MDDFKTERDTYIFKKWGYIHPASAISHEGQIMLGIEMSSPWDLEFEEFYTIKPIHNADVSKFQEVLGYQEPLRIDYANKAEEPLKQREEIGKRNGQLAQGYFSDILRRRISFCRRRNYKHG